MSIGVWRRRIPYLKSRVSMGRYGRTSLGGSDAYTARLAMVESLRYLVLRHGAGSHPASASNAADDRRAPLLGYQTVDLAGRPHLPGADLLADLCVLPHLESANRSIDCDSLLNRGGLALVRRWHQRLVHPSLQGNSHRRAPPGVRPSDARGIGRAGDAARARWPNASWIDTIGPPTFPSAARCPR